MTDLLTISALKVKTHIGVHAWEQRILQTLLLDIEIPIDISNCNGELNKTIDYDTLCGNITTFVESNAFALIETVAEQVAQKIKLEYLVSSVKVSVSKPHAVKNAGNVCVTVVLNQERKNKLV